MSTSDTQKSSEGARKKAFAALANISKIEVVGQGFKDAKELSIKTGEIRTVSPG